MLGIYFAVLLKFELNMAKVFIPIHSSDAKLQGLKEPIQIE